MAFITQNSSRRVSHALAAMLLLSFFVSVGLCQEGANTQAEPGKAARAAEADKAASPPTASWETIAATMQSAQTLLAAGDAGSTTQRRQREVVDYLDALIAAAAANQANQGGEPREPSPQNDTQTGPGDSPSTDGRAANPNAVESVERQGNAEVQSPEATGPRRTAAEEFWGRLPEHVRERVLQSAETRAIPKYRAAVEEYFQRLLESQPPQNPSDRD